MKLKKLAIAAVLLSSISLVGCTATASVSPNPSASASAMPGQMSFSGTLTGTEEVPAVNTAASGTVSLTLNESIKTGMLTMNFQGLSSAQTGAHIHGPAAVGTNAEVLIELPTGQLNNHTVTFTDTQMGYLKAGQLYVNVHTTNNPNGEIRAQLIAR